MKTLLLKILYTLDSELGEIELKFTYTPPPQRIALIELEGAMQAAKGEKKSIVVSSCKAYESQHWLSQQNILCGAVMAILSHG